MTYAIKSKNGMILKSNITYKIVMEQYKDDIVNGSLFLYTCPKNSKGFDQDYYIKCQIIGKKIVPIYEH